MHRESIFLEYLKAIYLAMKRSQSDQMFPDSKISNPKITKILEKNQTRQRELQFMLHKS